MTSYTFDIMADVLTQVFLHQLAIRRYCCSNLFLSLPTASRKTREGYGRTKNMEIGSGGVSLLHRIHGLSHFGTSIWRNVELLEHTQNHRSLHSFWSSFPSLCLLRNMAWRECYFAPSYRQEPYCHVGFPFCAVH